MNKNIQNAFRRQPWLSTAGAALLTVAVSLPLSVLAADAAPADKPAAAAEKPAAPPPADKPPMGKPPMMMGAPQAGGGMPQTGGGMMMGGGHQGMMQPGHDRMSEELKLTDDQRKAFQAAMQQMRGTAEEHVAMRREVHQAVESDNFDEAKLREMLHKHYADMESKDVESAKAMHGFYQSLTPEQKEKMKNMQHEMHGNMQDRLRERMQEHRHLQPPATLEKKPAAT